MKKQVLILSASPRQGGNSDLLCDAFLRGALESGHRAEKIFLKEKKIGYCMGCEACLHSSACVQKDDMEEILNKMVAADVIVMATPVYFYTMDAQLKTLIDRTVPRYTEISNKEFYFIITAADPNQASLERTVEGLRGFTEECLRNPVEKGVIYGFGLYGKGAVRDKPVMTQAYEMGKSV